MKIGIPKLIHVLIQIIVVIGVQLVSRSHHIKFKSRGEPSGWKFLLEVHPWNRNFTLQQKVRPTLKSISFQKGGCLPYLRRLSQQPSKKCNVKLFVLTWLIDHFPLRMHPNLLLTAGEDRSLTFYLHPTKHRSGYVYVYQKDETRALLYHPQERPNQNAKKSMQEI